MAAAAAAAGWLICEWRLCVWLRDADENNSNALQRNFATFGLIYTGRNFIQFPGTDTHRLTQTRHPATALDYNESGILSQFIHAGWSNKTRALGPGPKREINTADRLANHTGFILLGILFISLNYE